MSNEQLEFSAAMIAGGLVTSHHGLSAAEVAGKAISIAREIHDQLDAQTGNSNRVDADHGWGVSRSVSLAPFLRRDVAEASGNEAADETAELEPEAPKQPSSIVPA